MINYTTKEKFITLVDKCQFELFPKVTKPIEGDIRDIVKDVLGDDELTSGFLEKLPAIKDISYEDAFASFLKDPAADSLDEIFLCYPGWRAMFCHRVAHIFYQMDLKVVARIIAEYAHITTGVDIHPGATIGKGCFIDHATGIVIGETALVGEGVSIYQGVTLGATSLKGGRKALRGVKRHPTIGNNVTIYAYATILGGDTVISDGKTVKSYAFITESI